MPLEVIGAGFGRTGTNSLKIALQQLGYRKCHHMKEVFKSPRQAEYWDRISRGERPDWEEVFEGFRASVDWPSAAYWRELIEAYPEAKVVLSVRDPEAWYRSVSETIYPVSYVIPRWLGWFQPTIWRVMNTNRRLIWQGVFDGRFEDKAHAIEVYERNTEEVKRTVPPERLLVHHPADGWKPLCQFLGREVPDTPYPRVNEAAVIKRAVMVFRWLGRLPWIVLGMLGLGLIVWWF